MKTFFPFFLLLTGCALLDREPSPRLEHAPPYYQSVDPLADAQMYHNKSVKKMADNVHIVRNQEMEELEAANKLAEKNKLWEQDYEKTIKRREKWTNWFKKGQDETFMMSDRAKEINRNLN